MIKKANNILNKILECSLGFITALIIVVVFALFVTSEDKEKSEWENRYLQGFPTVTFGNVKDGTFMREFDDYAADQMPFRDGFIKIKSLCEMAIFKQENNGIVKGKDGQLFTKHTEDTKIFDKNANTISKYLSILSNENRNVTVAVIPNATGILLDKVPEGMPNINQIEKIDEFNSDISLLRNVNVIDLSRGLKKHEGEYIYYRTDHHWTTSGAYIAYSEISKTPVSIEQLNKNSVDDFYGTLYAKYKGTGVKCDIIDYYDISIDSLTFDDEVKDTLYDLSKIQVFDKYGLFLFGNKGKCVINSHNANNGKKLIVFKDSYANSLIPFLTYDYDEITIVDLRYFAGSVSELIEEKNDAEILFLYNFDFMNEDNHFFKLAM